MDIYGPSMATKSLPIAALLVLTACSDDRFQLSHGDIDVHGDRVPVLARIDTRTGQTWLYERRLLPQRGTNTAFLWEGWSEVPSAPSNTLAQLRSQRPAQ